MTPDSAFLFAADPGTVWLAIAALLSLAVVTAAGYWKTFQKAGEPGWAALVPVYNLWVMVRIAHCARFWFWLSFVPVLNWFAFVRVAVGVADQFGRGVPFGLGLVVLPWLCWPLLGFARFDYQPDFDAQTWNDARGAA